MSRASGFKKLRSGCIHTRCPKCGRKQSNMPRHPEFDHPTAFMVEMLCDGPCGSGVKDDAPEYFDKRGRALSAWFGRP